MDSPIGAWQSTQKALFNLKKKKKRMDTQVSLQASSFIVERETLLMKCQPTHTHYHLVFYPFTLPNEVILAQSLISTLTLNSSHPAADDNLSTLMQYHHLAG